MSDITIEQAEQQLAEAKQREAEVNKKPWELKPPTMGEMQTLTNLIDDVESKHSELEDARETLQNDWNEQVGAFNDSVDEFNGAQAILADHLNHNTDWRYSIEEYFVQEDEDNGVVVSDELRGHLTNISEKLDEFCVNDVEGEESDKYIEEADLSESHGVADDLLTQLNLLQEHLDKDKEEDPFLLITHRKKDVENWGNNQSVWQVYDDLKDEDVDVRALLLKYALSYYKPEGTSYVEMLKEMASEFGVDTDES